MTKTTAADYPSLGFDPAPGDQTAVDAVVTRLVQVDRAVQEIASVLNGADAGDWRGDAARAFRDLLDDDVRPKVTKVADAFDGARSAVSTWAGQLADHQTKARDYERQAHDAAQRAGAAQSRLGSLPSAPAPGDPPPQGAAERQQADRDADDRRAAQQASAQADAELDRIRGLARSLHDGPYTSDGEVAASRLKDAIDIAPEEPGWFESALDSLGDFFDAIGDALADLGDLVIDVLHKLAPLLQLIGDIASLLSGVLGLLSLIPGLQFLAPIALGLAVVALVSHYAARVGETGSFVAPLGESQFWLDAGSVALGAGGLAVTSKMGRLAQAARGSGATSPTFFRLMSSTAPAFTSSELNWMVGGWKITQASTILDGTQAANGGVTTVLDGLSGTSGPLFNKPVVR